MTSEERKKKVQEFRDYHQPVLDSLGLSDAKFQPKAPIKYQGKDYVSLFPSEVERGKDLYLEFADFDYNIIDKERKLYRVRFNPHYAEEMLSVGVDDSKKYYYPIEELEEVTIKTKHVIEHKLSNLEDAMISELTIRDLYSIIQNKPVSKKDWLNKVIQSK